MRHKVRDIHRAHPVIPTFDNKSELRATSSSRVHATAIFAATMDTTAAASTTRAPGAYQWRSPTDTAPAMQQTSQPPNLPPIVQEQAYQQPMTSQQPRPPTPTPPTRQPTPTPRTGQPTPAHQPRQPTPVQQQNQQIRQGPVQSSGQETPAPQEMQHD